MKMEASPPTPTPDELAAALKKDELVAAAEEASVPVAASDTKQDIAVKLAEADVNPLADTASDLGPAETGSLPRLYEGQRVTFVSGEHQGRMGYVVAINFVDGIQHLIANAQIPARSFAQVAEYVIRTRDARTDTLIAKPDEIIPLDDIQGWGRGVSSETPADTAVPA